MSDSSVHPGDDSRGVGVTAAEHSYRRLRTGILAGRYEFGARLGEVEVSKALGVSRTPVREALRRLRAEGLVEIVPHLGAQVATWAVHDVEEVYELRICLEPYGAARAAERIDQEGIAGLIRMCEQEADAIAARSVETVRALNADFHHMIMQASGNARLVGMTRPLIAVQGMLRTFRHYQPDQMLDHLAGHRRIVQALELRDGQWASAAMRSHLISAKQRVLQDKERMERDALTLVAD